METPLIHVADKHYNNCWLDSMLRKKCWTDAEDNVNEEEISQTHGKTDQNQHEQHPNETKDPKVESDMLLFVQKFVCTKNEEKDLKV